MYGVGADHANARARVVDAIRAADTVSRTAIVRATGLTPATVSGVVRGLLDEGLVVEVGRAPSTGGTPRRLLRMVPGSRYAVGIHLDHDGVRCVLVDLAGTVVAESRLDGVGDAEPVAVVRALAAEAHRLVADAAVDPASVLGLGVVAPGPLTPSRGMAMARPALHRWVDFPLVGRLEEASGWPVVVDNDATAAAVGEHWRRRAGDSVAFAALYMATGIGSGTIVDGVPYRGSSSNSGEVGHLCVDLGGPSCWCGSSGCIEAVGGPAAVVAEARAAGLDVGEPGREVLDAFAAVARAALAGDPVAGRIVAESARYVALAAHALCSVMDVELVVLTGPAFAVAGELYLPAVQERASMSLAARGPHGVRVEVSSHARRAAVVGAAALVLTSELVPRRFGVRVRAVEEHGAPARAGARP